MILTGTLINAILIVIGGIVGCLVGHKIPEKMKTIVMQASALAVVYIGISGAMQGKNTLVCILSLVIGAVIGEIIDIDKGMNNVGTVLETKFFSNSKSFAKGFVSATVLFCTGAMAIVGSIESGINLNHDILISKGLIDGTIAIIMASTLSVGVIFSGLSVLAYQGILTICASQIGSLLTDTVVTEMSCVGSIIIMAIGLNMLEITNIKIANLIPAAFLPILLCMFL